MTTDDTVLIVSQKSSSSRVYHTDAECHRLSSYDTPITEVRRELVDDRRDLCQWCAGEIEGPPPTAGSQRMRHRLLEADPEDVGLSPIGERGEF